eukprot:gene3844-7004_t
MIQTEILECTIEVCCFFFHGFDIKAKTQVDISKVVFKIVEKQFNIKKTDLVYDFELDIPSLCFQVTKIIGEGVLTKNTKYNFVNTQPEIMKFINFPLALSKDAEKRYFKIASEPTFEFSYELFIPQNENMSRKNKQLDQIKLSIFDKFLKPSECSNLIQHANSAGFSAIDKEYPKNYRNNKRLVSYATITSQTLWTRLQNLLKENEFDKITPFGYGHEGIWRPIGLNPCFKFSVYEEGDFFAPHFDGIYIPFENQTSIMTLMIYLNDDFEGGNTIFHSEKNQTLKIEKSIGKAILFNHDILHEGEKVTKGKKYILRTEIMFQRTNEFQIPKKIKNAYFYDENFRIAQNLYNKAEEYEKIEDPENYTKTYLDALKIHLEHHKSFEIDENDQFVQDDCLIYIFSFLNSNELASMMTVSHTWNLFAQNPKLWKYAFNKKWPNILKHKNEKFIDWFGMYRQQKCLDLNYSPSIIRIGTRTTSILINGHIERELSLINHAPHFSVSWYRTPDSEKFIIGKGCLYIQSSKHCFLNLDVFLKLITAHYYSRGPLLILEPPQGFNSEIRKMARKSVSEIGVAFSNVAVLALDYYNIKKGLYLHLSPGEHSVSYVENRKIIEIMKIEHQETYPTIKIVTVVGEFPDFSVPDAMNVTKVLDK